MNSIQFDQEAYGKLTAREIEIIRAAADGKSAEATANEIGASIWSIQNHRERARRKLNANSTAHAVAILIRGGII
jgi:LuxR family quorum sensing-dependent transcriptional regulator